MTTPTRSYEDVIAELPEPAPTRDELRERSRAARHWYAVSEPEGTDSEGGVVFTRPVPLARMDSSALADLIAGAADELAGRGYWKRSAEA